MSTRLLAPLLALTLAVGASAAQASSLTFNNWAFGSGNAVQASAPVYNGQAGAFSAVLDGNAIQTYCVELTQSFYWSTPYADYSESTALAYFGAASGKALKLGRLFSYVFDTAGAVNDAAESTSLQLAVWNIVYDADLTLAGGAFTDTSGYAAYGNTLLANSTNWVNSMNVWVLSSPTRQDQLRWARVPEPASLALALLAMLTAGAAGTARRRR
jgi:hypothetical protein